MSGGREREERERGEREREREGERKRREREREREKRRHIVAAWPRRCEEVAMLATFQAQLAHFPLFFLISVFAHLRHLRPNLCPVTMSKWVKLKIVERK